MPNIYLYAGETPSGNIRLRDPTVAGGAGFPTQYAGLRVFYSGSVHELCLVASADAPSGMGAAPHVDKVGTLYAVYLVDTTDTYASHVRIQTTTGVKAIRLKT